MNKETAERFREENRVRNIHYREELDEDERERIREENRIRNIHHREKQDEDERERIREEDRLRHIRSREEKSAYEAAQFREQENERKRFARKLKDTKIKPKDGLKTQEILEGTFIVPLLEDSFDAIGKMDVVCDHCGAYKFKSESSGLCCSNGKVVLKPFPRPPDDVLKRWKGQTPDDVLFRQHSRELNNALCISSIQVNQRHFAGYNPSVIFQGQMKHLVGSLLPSDGSRPKFAQLYCLDPALETTQRFQNMTIPADLSSSKKEKLKKLLKEMQDMIKRENPFVKDFLMILELEDEDILGGKLVISESAKPAEEHARRYNAPTGFNEVSIVTNETRYSIVIHKRGGGLQEIKDLNPKSMPLHFTLFFPYGTYGWDQTEKHEDGRRNVTIREWYMYHTFSRDNNNMNYIHDGRRLYQEFLCMAWVNTESQRLLFHTLNQKALRADTYKSVAQATEERLQGRDDHMVGHADDHQQHQQVGRKVLAASHHLSPRWYNKCLQDAIAICTKYSKPDFFITITTNPKWPEILICLEPGQTAQDRPDVVARVFKAKLEQLMKDIRKGELFGQVEAHLRVVEWQKRGLPHAHILLIMKEYDRHATPEFFNSVISAELPPNPDEATDEATRTQRQRLQDVVINNMLHGPCGEQKPNAACMQDGKCTKKFPKPFLKETYIDPQGLKVSYQRRSPEDGGRTIEHNGRTVDNSWVVPYNPFLSLRFDAHINVEAAASPKSSLYLFKYIHKGSDRACVNQQVEGQPRDEIAEYIDMRSVSSGEAYWHLAAFPVADRHPPVMALRVHLQDEQQVYFEEHTEEAALERGRQTELTAFFEFNQQHQQVNAATLPKYVDMPDEHVYDTKKKEWRKRKQNLNTVIGRVHAINPVSGDVYYLRLLLHDNHCKGKTSFADMLKLPNNTVCETYKQVCCELGLLADDREWERALEEAATTKMCPQIRLLYTMILMFCFPSNPRSLFDQFWEDWCDDFQFKAERRGVTLSQEQLKTLLLLDLELRLSSFEKTLPDFNLPVPTPEEIGQVEHITCNQPAVIREEMDYDFLELRAQLEQSVPSFTEEQAAVYNTVMEAVRNGQSIQVFLSARGGCGKTYLLNSILSSVRTMEPGGAIALAMATTGIAAILLQLGRTFHSRMKAPLTPDPDSTLTISAQSNLAQLIRLAKLILIDESTMLNRYLLEALDRTLRDLCQADIPFGGKTIILAGDFRQCLPIVPGANRAGIISQAVNQSHLWATFQVMELSENMRVRASGDQQLQEFDNWTLSIGNGQMEEVTIPKEMIATIITPNSKDNRNSEGQAMEQFCEAIFPNLATNIQDRNWVEGRAILAATNVEVNMLNEHLSSKLPGSADVLRSSDQFDNNQDGLRFNVEYLNSRLPNGFPAHALHLKPGLPLILLRNLDPKSGLCNGTKLIFQRCLFNKVLECKLSGTDKTVLIPRIVFIPKPGEFTFGWSRLQFPVKPGFAMTINKSQGKSNKSFYILSCSLNYSRSDSEPCGTLDEDGALYPRSAVRCGIQSGESKEPQVCPDGRPEWNSKEDQEHSLQ